MSALRHLASALGRALRWRLLLLFAALTALPALLGAAPLALFLDQSLAHAPAAAGLASGIDTALLPDLQRRAVEHGVGAGLLAGLAGALALTLLVSPWLTGAALAEVTSAERLKGRALLSAAGAFWGRLFRLALVSALPLGAAAGLVAAVQHRAGQAVEKALTETAALAIGQRALMATAAILFLALLTLDAARAVLAARPARRSAFLAWTSGTWLLLRRPYLVLPAGLLGTGLALALAFGFSALRTRLPAGPALALVASVLLAWLAAASLAAGRSLRLGLLARVALADAAAGEAREEARLRVRQAVESAQRTAVAETAARAAAAASLAEATAPPPADLTPGT